MHYFYSAFLFFINYLLKFNLKYDRINLCEVNMNKLWLYPENETPFQFNPTAEDDNLEARIILNQSTINAYAESHGPSIINKITKKQLVLNAISAAGLEQEDFTSELPPFKEEIEQENLLRIDDFMSAQNLLLNRLKKEPYLYVDLLPFLHKELSKNNLDLSRYEIGRLRDQYSSTPVIGYFTPTEGAKVASELNFAMCEWGYVDRTGKSNMFEKIAKLHAQIVRIQPFVDGNKRIAYLVTNAMLALHGFPTIELCHGAEENKNYNDSLKTAIVGRDVTPLARIFENKVLEQQEKIITAISVNETEHAINDLNKNTNRTKQ